MGINLINSNLSGQDIQGVNFVEANLRGANLTGANLRDADLSGANLLDANLSEANLSRANLIGTNLTRVDLREVILTGANLSGAILSGADLTRTDLTGARLRGVELIGAKLVEANLQGIELSGGTFRQANLNGANLSQAHLAGSIFSGADLSGAIMIETDVSGSWFNLTNLTGANLTRANMAGTSLIGANMASVNLTNGKLVGATLIGTDLSGANLRGTNLTGIRFFQAELRANDLILDETLVELNEIQLAAIIDNGDLSGVQYNEQTIWPPSKLALIADILGRDFNDLRPVATPEPVASPVPNNPVARLVPIVEPTPTPVAAEEQPIIAINPGIIQLMPISPTQQTGNIEIVGSTSMLPLNQFLANNFQTQGYTHTINFNSQGTIAGFEAFCSPDNTVDIVATTRLIREHELTNCLEIERQPLAFRVGTDAVTVVANPINDFVTDVTYADLASLFTAERWSDVNPNWPSELIVRFVPDETSDTFVFFVEQVLDGSPEQLTGAPNTTIEDRDQRLVQGVALNPYAIGLMDYAFYQRNTELVKLLSINGIVANLETVQEDQYPFIRALYLYSDADTILNRPQVGSFLNFYLANISQIVTEEGYFPATSLDLDRAEFGLMRAQGFE